MYIQNSSQGKPALACFNEGDARHPFSIGLHRLEVPVEHAFLECMPIAVLMRSLVASGGPGLYEIFTHSALDSNLMPLGS